MYFTVFLNKDDDDDGDDDNDMLTPGGDSHMKQMGMLVVSLRM